MRKKFLAVFMILSIFIASTIVNATPEKQTISTIITDEVTEYLLDAGYPQDLLNRLDDSTKQMFYEGKYSYISSDTTYGVLIENYDIKYSMNNNNVIIDNANLDQLNQLLADSDAIGKVLYDKRANIILDNSNINSVVIESEPDRVGDSTSVSTRSNSLVNYNLSNLNSEKDSIIDRYTIEAIQKETPLMALSTLSNWTGDLIVSHISQSNNYIRKVLTYSWSWNYAPIVTDIDKVGLAWSKKFNCQSDTVKWTYKMWGQADNGTARTYTYEDYGYDDYELESGVGKDIDIHDWFEWDDTPRYYVYKHSGTFSTEITGYFDKQDEASALARYYHHTIALTGGTLNFSSNPAISISAGFGSSYEKAPDSGEAFIFYK